MVKKYNKNDIIILKNNCVLNITKEKENNIYDIVVSNGESPVKLLYIFNITSNQISALEEVTNLMLSKSSNVIDTIITYLDSKIFSKDTVIEYLGEEYIFEKFYNNTSDSHIELKKVKPSTRGTAYNYTIDMTRKEFIEANMKNSKNLSYFEKNEIIPKVVNFQEMVEKNHLQDKETHDKVRSVNEDVFEDIILDIIENPKYEFTTDHKEIVKNKINSYQEMEKKYMDTIISKCDQAMDILDSNEGTELFNKTIEFFKTLSPNEKVSWSRDMRMKMDLIITNEEESPEIDFETVGNIVSSIKKDFYIIRK